METQPYLVEMRGVTKEFPGVRALAGVDFRLRAGGELRGLVGKNGAGKSTLMSVLTGVCGRDGGEIVVRGRSIPRMTTALSRQLGIACVHQHSQLVGPLSIAENVFCGDLPTGRFGLVDWETVYREAEERLGRLGLAIDVRRKVEGLTVAERQLIEIAKALFAEAQVIILDEATAPLPKSDVELLFGFVRRQRERGVAFVYISHYLEEIFELCENVTVMRDGRAIGDYAVSTLTPQALIRAISGAEVERFRHAAAAAGSTPVLELRELSRPDAYAHLTLTLARGEIVGLTGLEGCGKDALARGLYGLEPLGTGEVLLDGEPYRAADPRQALDRGVAYLPRDRHGLGIVGARPIQENISLPILSRLTNALGLLSRRRESDLVARLIASLDVKTPSAAQPVEFLSGGNQQKVVFAKLVGAGPRVLLLDEPTQGVDVQAKVEIMKIIDRLSREQQVATVVISEEIRELLDVCDRILVMFRGTIVAEFRTSDPSTTAERILRAVEGAAQP
ncbi:MAG TPA: sugar ABC transporter ATP-binding protein [Candidatus Sulfotelmatobacter sp.]|nr:sugar ABC transporter ATP-binding protein [Candidatus Sulfotelmatobacter sp.]